MMIFKRNSFRILFPFIGAFLFVILGSFGVVAGEDIKIDVKEIVRKWNSAHNNPNFRTFDSLYGSNLYFYGQNLPKFKCWKKKEKLLLAQPGFHQEIDSPISISFYENGLVKVDFVKKVWYKKDVKTYPAYLLLAMGDSNFLIVGESDSITDFKLKASPEIGSIIKEDFKPQILSPTRNSMIEDLFWYIIVIGIMGGTYLVWRNRRRKYISEDSKNSGKEETIHINPLLKFEGIEEQEKQSSYDEKAVQEKAKEKGFLFEQFIAEKFDQKYFKVLNWRSDKIAKGVYPESNMHPDLEVKFTYYDTVALMAIECKFRQAAVSGMVDLAGKDQLERYRKFQNEKKIPVYIALGFGGEPNQPENLFLLPLKNIETNKISIEDLKNYSRKVNGNFFYDRHTRRLT
jgi:hypothetical protein